MAASPKEFFCVQMVFQSIIDCYFMHSFWVGLQNAGPEKLLQLMKFLHKGECNYYTEKVFLLHFIHVSMQLNFPVLSMFSCVASFSLETEYFLEGWYLRTSLLQATLLPHSVYIDKTKEK